jgi:hypothetical protein
LKEEADRKNIAEAKAISDRKALEAANAKLAKDQAEA